MEKLSNLQSVDVDALLYDPEQVHTQVTMLWRKSMENVLTICRLLYLTRRRWGERSKIWEGVRDSLPFHRSTINKLIAIGRDKRLFDPKISKSLPPNWGTLHEITKYDDALLYSAVGAGDITPESSRADIIFIRQGDNKTASDPYRIQEEWLDEYLGYLSRVGEQSELRKSINLGGKTSVEKYNPVQIESHIRNITDPLYVVRVRRGCDITAIDAALSKLPELVAIEGVLPISVNRKTMRNAHQRTIERLLNLCALFYGQLIGEESWRISTYVDGERRDPLPYGISEDIKRFLDQERIITLLDYYSIQHPLYDLLTFYLEQIGGRVTYPATDARYQRGRSTQKSGEDLSHSLGSAGNDFMWMILREDLYIRLGNMDESQSFTFPKPQDIFTWENAAGSGWNPYPLSRVKEQADEFRKARGVASTKPQTLEEFMMNESISMGEMGSDGWDDDFDDDEFVGELEVGSRVYHDMFGIGVILDLYGDGARVSFDSERDPKRVRVSRLTKSAFQSDNK